MAFDTVKAAVARGADVAIIDTAGRLQTKVPLMEELAKIARVIGKELPGAPHETLLVLDANTGQNAISQAREFTQPHGRLGHRAHQARRHREGRRDRRASPTSWASR